MNALNWVQPIGRLNIFPLQHIIFSWLYMYGILYKRTLLSRYCAALDLLMVVGRQ
jgi:hypothetical protein